MAVGLVVSEGWKWAPVTSLLWHWVAPAALLAAAATRFWPAVSLQVSRACQVCYDRPNIALCHCAVNEPESIPTQARQREQAAASDGPWDEAFVAAFDPGSAQQRRRERVYSGGYYDRSQPVTSGFEVIRQASSSSVPPFLQPFSRLCAAEA